MARQSEPLLDIVDQCSHVSLTALALPACHFIEIWNLALLDFSTLLARDTVLPAPSVVLFDIHPLSTDTALCNIRLLRVNHSNLSSACRGR